MNNTSRRKDAKSSSSKKREAPTKAESESQRKSRRAQQELDNQKEASRSYAPKQPRIIEKGKVWDERRDSGKENGQSDMQNEKKRRFKRYQQEIAADLKRDTNEFLDFAEQSGAFAWIAGDTPSSKQQISNRDAGFPTSILPQEIQQNRQYRKNASMQQLHQEPKTMYGVSDYHDRQMANKPVGRVTSARVIPFTQGAVTRNRTSLNSKIQDIAGRKVKRNKQHDSGNLSIFNSERDRAQSTKLTSSIQHQNNSSGDLKVNSSTQYGTQLNRDKTGRSAETLLHMHQDIDHESSNSRLKQILNMYGLDRFNDYQQQSETKQKDKFVRSEMHSPPGGKPESSLLVNGICFEESEDANNESKTSVTEVSAQKNQSQSVTEIRPTLAHKLGLVKPLTSQTSNRRREKVEQSYITLQKRQEEKRQEQMNSLMKKLGLTDHTLATNAESPTTAQTKSKQQIDERKLKEKKESIEAYRNNTTFSKFNKHQSSLSTLNKIPQKLEEIKNKNKIKVERSGPSYTRQETFYEKKGPSDPKYFTENNYFDASFKSEARSSQIETKSKPRKSVLILSKEQREENKQKSIELLNTIQRKTLKNAPSSLDLRMSLQDRPPGLIQKTQEQLEALQARRSKRESSLVPKRVLAVTQEMQMLENMQNQAQVLQAKIDQTEEFKEEISQSSSQKSAVTSETHSDQSILTSIESSRQQTQEESFDNQISRKESSNLNRLVTPASDLLQLAEGNKKIRKQRKQRKQMKLMHEQQQSKIKELEEKSLVDQFRSSLKTVTDFGQLLQKHFNQDLYKMMKERIRYGMAAMFQQKIKGEKATSRIASYSKLQPVMLKVILAIKKDVQEYVKTGKIKKFRTRSQSPEVKFEDVDGETPRHSQSNQSGDNLKSLKTFMVPSEHSVKRFQSVQFQPLPENSRRRLSQVERGQVGNSLNSLLGKFRSEQNKAGLNNASSPTSKITISLLDDAGSPEKDAHETVSKFSLHSLNSMLKTEKNKSEHKAQNGLINNNFSFNASEDIKNGKIIRERYKQEADLCACAQNFQDQKSSFLKSLEFLSKNAEQQCLELYAKKRFIVQQEKDQISKLVATDEFQIPNIRNNTKRLDFDITGQHNETLVNLFQDFVLEYNRVSFTNGKRKLLLFTVLKAEGDIFQELREYDKAIRAYKSLKNYCDIWTLKYPAMMTCEQIGLCYRLMRMHGQAVDFFKKQLEISWEIESQRDERLAYQNIATEYYYIGDLYKMKVYEEKFMNGHNEDSTSAMKNAAVTRLKRQTPQFNVFQAQRRGISVKDVEKGPNYCYAAEKKEVSGADIIESLKSAQADHLEVIHEGRHKQSRSLSKVQMKQKYSAKQAKVNEDKQLREEKRRRVKLLRVQGFSRDELKDYKIGYHVQHCFGTRIPPDDGLTLDEKFMAMARASKQKIFLNNKNIEYSTRLPFKGQQNPGRIQALSDVEDYQRLHNVRALLKKLDKDIGRFLSLYEEDDNIKEEGKRKKRMFENKMKNAIFSMFKK